MGGEFDWSKISEAQIRDLSEKMFDAAEIPSDIRQAYWEWFERTKQSLGSGK